MCESSFNDLSPYWDILRESGMNETEDFTWIYLELQYWVDLLKYLIDNVMPSLERFLERTYSMYKNIETLFPNMNDVFKMLGTGDRRFCSVFEV